MPSLRSAVAVLVTAAAGGLGVVAGAPAAAAAPCSGTAGVTVVVEPGSLGGGTSQACATDGAGRTADRLLRETGHSLDFVQRFPGFVCRVDGVPVDDPCVNTPPDDAYWGLWWSDGVSGKWTYSSLGAGSLSVPAGGYVAMVWDGSTGSVRPASVPTPHPTATPAPTPTKAPTPTRAPTSAATPTAAPTTTPTRSATESPTATSKPSKQPRPSKTRKPSATPTPTASPAPSDESSEAGGTVGDLPPSDPGTSDDDGLPGWVPPVLVAVLLAAAGGVAVVRRRS